MADSPIQPTNTAPPQQQALARARRDLGGLIQGTEFREALAAVLPKHCTAERFARVVLTATMRTPDLLKCSRESFFKCCFDLSAMGLEPDGRRAHLIPRKTGRKCVCGDWQNQHRGDSGPCGRCSCQSYQVGMECTLVVDYKGLVDLVRRSGEVAYIHADVVYEKDEWDFCYGSNAFLKHKPNLKDHGKSVIAIYSFVKLKDGTEDFIVLSQQDVEKVRSASPAKDEGPWKSWWDEMAKKTAFRRHSKWLPFSSELRESIEKDDEYVGAAEVGNSEAGRATLSLDMFRASEDEHRGHDESMEGAARQQEETAAATEAAAPAKEATPAQAKPAQAQPIRRYAHGEMPDAMECRIGLEAYHDGEHFRVEADGDLQRWIMIGKAPHEAAAEDETLASKPSGNKGRGRNANAFDFNAKEK